MGKASIPHTQMWAKLIAFQFIGMTFSDKLENYPIYRKKYQLSPQFPLAVVVPTLLRSLV